MHVFPRVFHFSVTLRISFDFQLNVVSLQSTSITINQLTKNIRRPTDWRAKYRDGGLRGNVLWGTPFLPLVPSVSRRLAPPILLFSISVKRMPHKFRAVEPHPAESKGIQNISYGQFQPIPSHT